MPTSTSQETFACWLSSPDIAFVEIAKQKGFTSIVLDIEHGTFDLKDQHMIILACKALGFYVYAKILGPTPEAIQQVLDFGANAVVVPHVRNAKHAADLAKVAKYPPEGERSYAGTRQTCYGGPQGDYFNEENQNTKFYAMVESKEGLDDIEGILAVPAVAGIFVGPFDLSLMSYGKGYKFTDDDAADLKLIAQAAEKSGKEWIMPAWSPREREFAAANNVKKMVIAAQYATVHRGFDQMLQELQAEKMI